MSILAVRCSAAADCGRSSSDHASQVSGESWQYALLLPRCVRPYSSPAVSMGTPAESSRVPRRFRMLRRRAARTSGSAASPSTPWLYERL